MSEIKLNEKISNRNFVINFRDLPFDDFAAFGEGYHLAAKNLTENLIKKHNFPDYEGYPIIFLYRHSLELYLKFLIYKSAKLINFKSLKFLQIKLENSHKLIYLSNLAKDLLIKLFPNDKGLEDLMPEIIELCKQFETLDENSYSFRYPITTKGEISTDKHLVVNIDSVYNTMEKYLEILSNFHFGLNVEEENIYYVIEQLNLELY